MRRSRWGVLSMVAAISLTAVGCGHTDEEMAERQRQIDKLAAEIKAAHSLHEDDQQKYNTAQGEMEQLRSQLQQAGLAGQRSKEQADALQKALAEYKQRAEQLQAMEQRFRDLRSRLEKLVSVGVKFVMRNNRMVIQLPGDILFDSGKDQLKKEGKDVLLQVAEVIRNDKDLSQRNFQVAGHTDNAHYPPGGPFRDNWGLSLARARQVLLFLIAPPADEKAPKKAKDDKSGGGLSPKRWAAAGYGEMDPQEGNVEKQSTPEQQKNRRVELVLQPNVDEMLDLKNIK